MAKRRPQQHEIVAACRALFGEAFPGREIFERVVHDWMDLVAVTIKERCGMCRRTLLQGPVIQREFGERGVRCYRDFDFLRGWGEAACGPCVEASAEALVGPADGRPPWSMVLAELSRARTRMDEEVAAAAWKLLARRPIAGGGGRCLLCRKKSPGPLARGQHKRMCAPCARAGREALRTGPVETTLRTPPPRENVEPAPTIAATPRLRCPRCNATNVDVVDSAWAFTGEGYATMRCGGCGFEETCNEYEAGSWYG